jgi:hypothetical protein
VSPINGTTGIIPSAEATTILLLLYHDLLGRSLLILHATLRWALVVALLRWAAIAGRSLSASGVLSLSQMYAQHDTVSAVFIPLLGILWVALRWSLLIATLLVATLLLVVLIRAHFGASEKTMRSSR